MKKTESIRGRLLRRGGIVAGLAALAGLAVVGSAAAAAHSPAASHHPSGPRPTIVLVHGAWANGSSWNGVVRRLQADGYTVDVPANPLMGLAFDPAYLADFLQSISGPIVLVGHSYGGAVITNAATRKTSRSRPSSMWTRSRPTRARPSASSSPWCPGPASWPRTRPPSSTSRRIQARHPGCSTRITSRTCSPPASPTVCRCVKPGCCCHRGATVDHRAGPEERRASLEDHPVLGRGRHRRPGHPARVAAGHGPARARPHHQVRAPHLSMISDPGVVTRVILKAVHATG